MADLETRGELHPPAGEARPPDPRIGPYRLVRLLGRGGMGEVFLAHDEHLDRQVAIKRIRPEGGRSEAERRRFQREARAAARLGHSAIVHVYDLGHDSAGDDYLVLEYVAGETLAERLARGPLDPAFAVARAAEIAEGLAAAHEAGFLHRDLKAGNVMLTPDGHAKILDFGLVRPLDAAAVSAELTHRGAIVGTCHAMSPEQAAGDELDARSDLFSLGSLLYEMLAGTAPFRGDHPLDSLRRVAEATPRPLRELRPDLPAELERLVAELLARRREDRPATAREVAARLSTLAVQLGSTASGVAWPRPSPRLRRWGLAAAAALTLSGLALGAFYLLRPTRVRIAVPSPVLPGGTNDPELALAASAALSSAIATLASLEEIVPIDPVEANRANLGQDHPPSPIAVAQATAAEEVLSITLEPQQGRGQVMVTLRRVDARGVDRWSDRFNVVATDSADLPILGDAVAAHLQQAFPHHRLRSGGMRLEVGGEDYARFLAIYQSVVKQGSADTPDLYQLQKIVASSPHFLEGYLLASRVARFLFRRDLDPSLLDQASQLIARARQRFPDDPRPLVEEFNVAVEAYHLEVAEKILGTLEQRLPGDPQLAPLRARLLEKQGRKDEALKLRRAAVASAPSWQNLYWLAGLEADLGDLEQARKHLASILGQAPDNLWARQMLGWVELYYGEPARAEALYGEVASDNGQRSDYNNLGLARSLSCDYAGAIAAYQRALEIGRGHFIARFNLADIYNEVGRRQEAQLLYRQALDQIRKSEREVGLPPSTAVVKAKCLARLDQADEAVTLAQAVLRQNPNEPHILYDAAEVFLITRNLSVARENARAALAGGIQPRWFAGSVWSPLLEDPELKRLLANVGCKGDPMKDPHSRSDKSAAVTAKG